MNKSKQVHFVLIILKGCRFLREDRGHLTHLGTKKAESALSQVPGRSSKNYEIKLLNILHFFRSYESLAFICISYSTHHKKSQLLSKIQICFQIPSNNTAKKKSKRKTMQMPCLAHKLNFTFYVNQLFILLKILFFEIRANWDNNFYLTNIIK